MEILSFKSFESINNNKYIAYHGTNNEFEHFDYTYIGHGLDEYGPGFYFTNDYEEAQKYGKVSKYELTIDKFIKKDKKNSTNMVSKLIRMAPEYKDSLLDFSEYENKAFSVAFNAFTRDSYDIVDAALGVWGDFYLRKGNSRQFVENMVKLKYDGYIIEQGDNIKYIMYNINNIRRIS